MYGGMANAGYITSIMQLQQVLAKLNVPFMFSFLIGESLITRARNKLCKIFMENQGASHLLFIDADIQFDPMDVIRLINADKDIIGCSYACKTLLWDRVSEAAKRGATDPRELSMAALSGVYNKVQQDTDNNPELEEVYEIGTGMMLIKRGVLQKMMEASPDDFIFLDDPTDVHKSMEDRKYHRFFDTATLEHRYYSEDYMFCKRWRELGGKTHLLKKTLTKHWGTYAYEYLHNPH
jgi:hypothetical protein